MDQSDYFKIGYIAKTHGLKGGVSAILSTEFDLEDSINVHVELNNLLVPYILENISDRGDKAFIKLGGVNTPEEASLLKGAGLFLSKKDRPKLKRGDFYDDEIIGFEILDETLGMVGHVKEIIETGFNKLIVVETSTEKELLIPVNAPFIISVQKSKKKLLVDLPEGLLDI
jgi:16S rRNA processing protein RimM